MGKENKQTIFKVSNTKEHQTRLLVLRDYLNEEKTQ